MKMSEKRFVARTAFFLAFIGIAFGAYNYYRATVAKIAIDNLETRIGYTESIIQKMLVSEITRQNAPFEFPVPTTRN
jgi:hypothetical protein